MDLWVVKYASRRSKMGTFRAIASSARQAGRLRPRPVSGAMIGFPFTSAYGASKGGVAALTYAWASDLAGSGVRVNAVSPVAWTRMAETADPPDGFEGDWQAQKLAVAHLTPEQNAPVVIFLLSDRSARVLGQVVRIQGPALS